MKKYLAAVSGGPDSMAMLSKYKRKIYVVCHVNYHKRDSSIRDENIVKKFCSENKIKCEVLNVTKKIYHSYKEKNFEHLARNIRYDFFCEIGKKYNIDKLLVAHNEDDFLETALMQKNKKSKTLFLGIKKNSNYKWLKIYRPLLKYRKKDLEKYCEKNKIQFGIDETNFLPIYERNKIRKEITTFSDKKYHTILKEIFNYNKKNKKNIKKINHLYKEWCTNNFLAKLFIKKICDVDKNYVIYNFLSTFDVPNISAKKIEQVKKFIECARVNTKQRLGSNLYVCKNKKQEIIIQ